MISPANLPSPAGYSFGSHEPISRLEDIPRIQDSLSQEHYDNNNNGHTTSPSLLTVTHSSSSSSSSPSSASIGTTNNNNNSTPTTTFQKSAPAASSLSVALCRSLVLKYIYLAYLFLLQLFVWPAAVLQKFLYRISSKKRSGRRDVQQQQYQQSLLRSGSGSLGTTTGEGGDGAVAVGSAGQDNSNNNLNHNSSDNNGNSMLRRSSRFKSRSDLEAIAQSSTPTGISTSRRPLLSSISSGSSIAAAAAVSNTTTTLASGYGTDSMAEDGGSGDNSRLRGNNNNRLRQRTGRPMSGLGVPGGHGYGGINARKKTLVLDLDETLIHSTSRGSRSQGYMVEVLVSEWYKLVIFTASMAEYADPVIDWLDQSRTLFEKRYFRQ
ncbi:Nuclear envelope morphology protein 1, partial [Entomortierella lignicola]